MYLHFLAGSWPTLLEQNDPLKGVPSDLRVSALSTGLKTALLTTVYVSLIAFKMHFTKLQICFLVSLSEFGPSRVFFCRIHFHLTRHCCTLNLEVRLYLFLSFPWFLFHYFKDPSFQSWVSLPLAAISKDAGYSPMDLKVLNNISNCGHRNTKLLGGGLVVFTLTILGNFFIPHLLRQVYFSFFCLYSVWYTQ